MPQLDGADIGTVEIDPFVYQLQVGYRFGKPAPVVAEGCGAAATSSSAPSAAAASAAEGL